MLDFSQFDRRRYPTVSVRQGYREWLSSYEMTVPAEMDLVLLERLESIPWSAISVSFRIRTVMARHRYFIASSSSR
jgi:hypothetical protein